MSTVADLMLALHLCRKPMIAAVQGYALGLGAAIAVMCDIVIASADTHF